MSRREEVRKTKENLLPIHRYQEQIVELIRDNQVSIIQAETGSGKSTQIPQFLLDRDRNCRIVVSQPRRMAAIAVATRVAFEMGSDLGQLVGFHIKGECKTTSATQVTYMTCGILIQMVSHIPIATPLPWDYVIMDEVHERSIEMDFLLIVFKYFLAKGKNFKLILMSATLQDILAGYFSPKNIQSLKEKSLHFNGESATEETVDWSTDLDDFKSCSRQTTFHKSSVTTVSAFVNASDAIKIFSTDARKHKIHIKYLKDITAIVNQDSVIKFLKRLNRDAELINFNEITQLFNSFRSEDPDSIDNLLYIIAVRLIISQYLNGGIESNHTFLVFLPGIQEISTMYEMLQSYFVEEFSRLDIIMLHSSIPEKEHIKVLKAPKKNCQRIILSTNIAESSITLPDVSFVIDFCLSREVYFNSKTTTENLMLVWAAKATMQQRAGRSGRVAEGTVYRLITSDFHHQMNEYPKPEMQRSCLDKIILKLKLMEIQEPKKILAETIEPPSMTQIITSEQYLIEMGAIDSRGNISRIGRIYTDMPYDIKATRLCIYGVMFHCVKAAVLCASIISLEKPPIASYSNMRPTESISHPLTYRQRLIYSKNTNSDLLMYINVYNHWYQLFGHKVEEVMFKHGHRHIRTIKPTFEEREFCQRHHFEINSLREILSNYLDIKKRFSDLKLDPTYWNEEADEVTIKLCLAAAFSDRLLISTYEIQDDKIRNREIEKLEHKNTLYITKVQEMVDEEDMKNLLKIVPEPPKVVRKLHQQMFVEYGDDVDIRTLKFTLWLGNYSRRYLNLAWVVMKELRGSIKKWIKPNPYLVPKIPNEYRREGNNYKVYDNRLGQDVEVNYLKRIEFPFRLHFRDLITGEVVRTEEDSVNAVMISYKPQLATIHALICTEYLERGNGFIGRNSTMLPLFEFLPYAVILIFTHRVAYIPDKSNKRYLGFTVYPDCTVEFRTLFTQEDAISINAIRNKITSCINNTDYIENSGFSVEIVKDIVDLVEKPRIPIDLHAPDWIKALNIDIPIRPKEPREVSCDAFLPSIQLLDVSEDTNFIVKNIEKFQEMKQEYLNQIHRHAELINVTESFIVCSECLQTICITSRLKLVSENPVYFSMRVSYGALNESSELQHSDYRDYVEGNFILTQWELCNQGHTIGWSDDHGTYFAPNAPIKILLPMMEYLDFEDKYWKNDFNEVNLKKEANLKRLAQMKIEKICKICGEEFKSDDEFARHVKLNDKHEKKEAEFMKTYIC